MLSPTEIMYLSQIENNIKNFKYQIQHDVIDNLHHPTLQLNLTIALDYLITNSNSDQFAAQMQILKQVQNDRGIQYLQLVSFTNMLIINLYNRDKLLGNPKIINDITQ